MNILKVLTGKRLTGNFGERKAAAFLKKNGYRILERGYVGNGNEIDIVARIDNTVVFVEVKTRSIGSQSQKEPRPASSVTPEKQRKIIKASSEFMRSRRLNKRMRYDVIEVYLENGEKKKRVKEIKHLVSTFDITTAFCRQFSNNN